jgi:hypothetical protein
MPQIAIAIFTMPLLFPFAAGTQSATDFSGTWKMDAARSESAHQAVPIGPVTLVIKQTATELSIETRRSDPDKGEIHSEILTYRWSGENRGWYGRRPHQDPGALGWNETSDRNDAQHSRIDGYYNVCSQPQP